MSVLSEVATGRSSELSRRRRAIYAGLLSCLDPHRAVEGTRLWNAEFSNTPLYAVQSFLTRLYEVLDIDIPRAELQRKILQSLVKELKDLPEDPLASFSNTYTPPSTQTEASHKVFTYFMDYLLAGIAKTQSGTELTIKVYILDHAHRAGIQGEALNNVKQWLTESGQPTLIRSLELKQMRQLFHFCYVACCEYLGPVLTDRLVVESVRIVEQLPESAEFKPRKLF